LAHSLKDIVTSKEL